MFFKKILKYTFVFFLVFLLFYGLAWILSIKKNDQVIFGVSFSPDYARYLQLDEKKVFAKIINDWEFKYVRIPVQWNIVEKEPGNFDFSETDYYLAEAEKDKIKIILAIGQKTPRWPECHIPVWAEKLNENDYKVGLNKYITEVVNRYKNNPTVEMWQVENEPFLPFGICKVYNYKSLKEEINLVKSLDLSRQVITTDSGELSTWQRSGRAADLFGTTMYRIVWSKYFGYQNYDLLPPFFYKMKLWLAGKNISQAFVMELQAEPWIADVNLETTSLDEQYKSMNVKLFEKNIIYAQKVGFPRAYLWGAEWWYWMSEKKGVGDFVEEIKKLKKE